MKYLFTFKRLLLASCVALTLPLAAHAEPATEDRGHQTCERHTPDHSDHQVDSGMRGMGIPPQLRYLDLTEAQEDSIFKFMHGQIPGMREQFKQKRQAMAELRKLSNSASFDEAKAQKLADKLAALEKEFILTRARNESRIYSLLTPQQRQKLEEHKQERHDHGQDEFVRFKPRHSEMPIFRQS